jgi:hypothetical protein
MCDWDAPARSSEAEPVLFEGCLNPVQSLRTHAVQPCQFPPGHPCELAQGRIAGAVQCDTARHLSGVRTRTSDSPERQHTA